MIAGHCSLFIKAAASGLTPETHPRRDDLQQIGGRLVEIEQLLKSSRDLQLPLNENVTNVVSKLAELSGQVQKLSQDRENTETKLQRNERDCVLLLEMQMVHDEEKCRLLQEMFNGKKREIKRLQEELKQKECKLEQTRQKATSLQEKLSKVQDELKVKHEGVKKLQKEKEELTKAYKSERENVHKLVRSTFALTSDRDEMKVQHISTTTIGALIMLILRQNSGVMPFRLFPFRLIPFRLTKCASVPFRLKLFFVAT